MTTWRDAKQRQEEVRAAFREGFLKGESMVWNVAAGGEKEAWDTSRARAQLSVPILPEICPHGCGSRDFRMDAKGRDLICGHCFRPAYPPAPSRAKAPDRLRPGQIQIGDAVERTLAGDDNSH